MADTFTSLLRLVLQETGGNQNVWGDINNASAIDLLEDAIAARLDLDVTPATNPIPLTAENGADDQARNSVIALTGNPGEAKEIIVPSTAKLYIISNETSPGFDMTIKTVANAGVAVRPGTRVAVTVDPVADDVFEIGFVPTASEDEAGVAEIATQAEVDAGTDDERIITPLKYESSSQIAQATDSTLGRVVLADQAEVDLGSDADKVITPATYEGRKSSTDLSGHIEIATQQEVDDGVDTERAVTPATLAGGSFTGEFAGCVLTRAADHTSGHTSPTFDAADEVPIPFTGETIDTGAAQFGTQFHDNSTNNERITIPAGVNVVWLWGGVSWDQFNQNGTGMWHMRIRKNGSVTATIDPGMGLYIPHYTAEFFGGFAGTPDSNISGTIVSVPINVEEDDFFELTTMSQGSDFGNLRIQGGTAVFALQVLG